MAKYIGQNKHRVAEAVTVKVLIADSAVRFWAKHRNLSIREARKNLTKHILLSGEYANTLYANFGQAFLCESDDLDILMKSSSYEEYDGNDTGWYRVIVS